MTYSMYLMDLMEISIGGCGEHTYDFANIALDRFYCLIVDRMGQLEDRWNGWDR
jgi:hypothetical protein